MRVSRAWRDIFARIQAGYGHNTETPVGPGDLAVFCPACPQPGVNLPDGWKNDERRWVIIYHTLLIHQLLFLAGCILGAL